MNNVTNINTVVKVNYSDTRQHIIDTARDIILGKGFSAVGLNEILTTASVPKGSFYHYFKSKEQFGTAMLEDFFDGYLLKIESALGDQTLPCKTRLLNYFGLWLTTQSSEETHEKCLVVKLAAEVTDLSESMRIALAHGTDRVIKRIKICLDEAIANKELQSVDTQALTFELYHMWVGATLLTKVNRNTTTLSAAMATTQARLAAISLQS